MVRFESKENEMKLRSAAVLLIIAATGVWAQTAAPARSMAGRQRSVMATSTDADSKTAEMRAKAAVNQRVQEMETTLTKMHLLLKQMQASPAVKNSKDPMTKANLEMWGLMVQQLDKQFDQVKVAAREREDLEARRSAMYKQAQEKAAQSARNAQAQANAGAGQSAGATATPQSGSQPAAAPQTAQTPASSSPN
jgi:F0F1-type ATP synthase membrane subunit b/b'